MSDYLKYRGKCKELSEALCLADPTLTLVRGHYICWSWGSQPHWWCKKEDGTIVDPSVDQFPKPHVGEYVEFDGTIQCSNCGAETNEDEAYFDSNYAFCSSRCYGHFIGL